MIDFACKSFDLDEVIRCGLALTKSDYKLMKFLIRRNNKYFTTSELKKELDMDLSTIQRAVKKLYEKRVIKRMQRNLSGGGYTFVYSIKSKREIKEIVMSIVNGWASKVEHEMEKWA